MFKLDRNNLKLYIRNLIQEAHSVYNESEIDEERITNPDSVEFVKNKTNFIGSHIFGDRYANPSDENDFIYVTYSYNYDNPIFLYFKKKWYENREPYYYDGEEVTQTEIHRDNMRPTDSTHTLSKEKMIKIINKWKKKRGIVEEPHTEVVPGEKN